MKQKTTFKMLLALMLFAFCGNGAWAQTVKEVFHESFTGSTSDLTNASGKISTDVAGWTFVKGSGAGDAIKLGTSKALGSAETPALGIEGDATLTFKAQAWKNDAKVLKVSIIGGGSLSVATVDVKNVGGAVENWTDFTIQITGATASSKIKFEGNQAKKARFYLDEVVITQEAGPVDPSLNPQDLSFSQSAFTIVEGETFTAPTLTGAHTAVTYTSSNAKVATVVAETGVVTLAGGLGTTTISAVAPEGEVNGVKYAEGTASYTLTVKAAPVAVANIADFLAKGKADNTKVYEFQNPVVAVAQSGNNLWIQDNTASLMVYGNLNQTYVAGDEIPAGFSGKYKEFYGTVELVDGEGFAPKSQSGVQVNAEEKTFGTIAEADVNKNVLVKNVVALSATELSDGTVTFPVQKRFNVEVPNDGVLYDVTGIVFLDHGALKLLPLSYAKVQNGKLNQNLSFAQPAYKAVMGQPFEAPQVLGAQTAVTYFSSDEAVATVDAATGAVTLVKAGVVTIMATAAADEQYNMALASYELVIEGAGATLPFMQEFSKANPIDSRFVVEGVGNYSFANTCLKFGETGNSLILKLAEAPEALSYCVRWNGSGTFGAFVVETSEDGLTYTELKKYVNGDLKSNTDVNVQFALNENVRYIRWTYTEKVGGNVALGAIYVTKMGEGSTLPLEVSAAKYATVFMDEAFIMPEGLVGNTVKVVGTSVKLNAEYVAGEVVPAQTPLLLAGEAGTYQAGKTIYEAKAPKANDLKGASTNDVITAPANTKLYILANDSENGLGFYFQGATGDGSTVQNLAGKAYLSVTATPDQPAAVQGYRLDGGDITGIEAVEAANENAAIYTLAGVRVNAEKGNLPKGLYIINGKKVLVK